MSKRTLLELLELAKGNRSLNTFAQHANVSAGNLSRVFNGQKPTPELLKKISLKAYNEVTYEQLMEAAGYIGNSTSINDITNKSNEDIFEQLGTIIKRDAKPLTDKDKERLLRIIESAWPVDEEKS